MILFDPAAVGSPGRPSRLGGSLSTVVGSLIVS